MGEKGLVHLYPLIFLAIGILVVGLVARNPALLRFSVKLTPPTPTPSASPTQSPSATATPTATPTQTPKASGTPVPTTKPTPAPFSGPPGAGYSYITVGTERGNFAASVLSIDLNSARAITDTANDSDCADNCPVKSLADFVSANGGFAGVNGSYFCPETYPECAGKKNSFDFPVYNSRLGKWINGGNLFWNSRSIVYFDGGGAYYLQNANSFGGGLSAGVVNYPGLVNSGQVQIDDNQSGLSDKQKAVGTKVGIGVLGPKNIIIVIANSVNMQQFGYVFKALGASGALNLDTGGSIALYYSGYKAGPGRNIPNAIIFAR